MCIFLLILINNILHLSDNKLNTEIIIVSGLRDGQNMSILQDDMKILFHLNNKTLNSYSFKRNKRETTSATKATKDKIKKHNHVKFKDNERQKLRKMISEHDVLCNDESHKEACKALVMKIKMLTENNFSNHVDDKNAINVKKSKDTKNKAKVDTYSTDVLKRETAYKFMGLPKSIEVEGTHPFGNPQQISHSHTFSRDAPNTQLTNNYLLARRMRQSFVDLQGKFI